jgi:cell division septation protein DedD
MSDESVREIQLNGKQLVFLFMTATVVAVVIFLCGVMVGRGVTTPRTVASAVVASAGTTDPTSSSSTEPGVPVDTGDSGEPIAVQGDLKDLSYIKRLESPEPAPEPPVEPAPAPQVLPANNERPPVASPPPRTSESASGEPKGDGFVVQVASFRTRDEADAIARRLSAKGFPSFVSTPGSGGPRVFRVRVGKYPDRREAETIARRLEQEEQFKPWITR